MSFSKLTFPLTVDSTGTGYWIGDQGPFKYGEAITAFFIGDDLTDGVRDSLLLMKDLEEILKTFGGHLQGWRPPRGLRSGLRSLKSCGRS